LSDVNSVWQMHTAVMANQNESLASDLASKDLPLAGIRVIELGQLIAGPFASRILADFGASVIKVEPINDGDPLRKWRMLHEGLSVWWEAQSRNKESIALDLSQPEGAEIVLRMAGQADVLIENFRPGTLEKWGLSWEKLHAINPQLVMLRISGYGQTGPYSHRPGFGVVGEAMGGLRHLCAHPGEIPVRTGLSIGDSLAALHGVIGVLIALLARNGKSEQIGKGQMIDVALYESVFNLTESLLPEYSGFGIARAPAGSALPGIAPSNAYRCRDGIVLIAGNGDGIFKRLMRLIQREDLADDPLLRNNDGRVAQVTMLDQAIERWTQTLGLEDCLRLLEEAGIPAGKVFTAADIAGDAHYKARDMLLNTKTATGLDIQVPGIMPKLSQTPGAIYKPAPTLGQHTQKILSQLGYSDSEQKSLRELEIIGLGELA
jgi:formyl-CoA transferase